MESKQTLRIETERLVVRNWGIEDGAIYQAMSTDVGYTAFSIPGQFFTRDTEELETKIKQRIELFNCHGIGKFILEDRSSGESSRS